MILDFFNERSIKRFVFILFYLTALFWQEIIAVGEPCAAHSIISVDNFLHNVAAANIYLSASIKLLLLLACSYGFIIMLSVNDVLPKRKYLAVLLFWAVVSGFANSQTFANNLCALLFQIFAFYHVFRIYHRDTVKSSIFISVFFVGISSMFSFPFIASTLNILIGLWIFHIVKWRDMAAILLGLLMPFVFLLYFFQLAYHDINLMWQLIENNFAQSVSVSFSLDNFYHLTTVFLGFVFLAGFLSIVKIAAIKRTKNIYKMTEQLFYFVFFTSAIIFVTVYGMRTYAITLFGISSAYLLTRFSQIAKRIWFAELIIYLILLAAVAYNNYELLI